MALTRAERYLYCTWAPMPDNAQQQKVSEFYREVTVDDHVLTREPPVLSLPPKLAAQQRKAEITLPLTFTELKYYFLCPYQFKLRFLYGFDAPINRALGYGKSLHDALAEIHSESLRGSIPSIDEVPRLVEQHLNLPFANTQVEQFLTRAATEALTRYLREHYAELHTLEHVEKVIELKLEEGIVVSGRIDLIRHTDTGEIVVVDFKSDERAQAENITQTQLHVYAAGYEQLTGQLPDLIEIHNMDREGAMREIVDEALIDTTKGDIRRAGRELKANALPRLREWGETCSRCEFAGICRSRPARPEGRIEIPGAS